MKKNKLILFVVFASLIVLFSFLSSALEVTSDTTFNINKTQNIDKEIQLTIRNNEIFEIVNITSSNQDILEFDKFNLDSGETKNITATIVNNNNFEGEIIIKGYYQTDVGEANETHIVEVQYTEPKLSQCDFSIIKGDSVRWVNNVPDYITLKNTETQNIIKEINENDNYTSKFETIEDLKYIILRRGYVFTQECKITVLDTSGYVHNPQYDESLYFIINMEYEPTEINLNIIEDEFEMEFTEQKQDLFLIKNIGDKKAKQIQLSGKWLSFSHNNFDLDAGESKTLGYTITPIITQTNQTNKTYKINITADGNFDIKREELEVFIKYSQISDDYNLTTIDESVIKYLLKQYCEDHPDEDFCQPKVIRYYNSTQEKFNYTFSREQVDNLWGFMFEKADEDKEITKQQNEKIEKSLNASLSSQNMTKEIKNNIVELKKQAEQSNALAIFFGLFFGFLVSLGVILYLIINERARHKITKFVGFQKGEKVY